MSYNDLKKVNGAQTCEFIDLTLDWCRYVSDEYLAAGSISIPSIAQGYTGVIAIAGGNATLWDQSNNYLRVNDELVKVDIDSDTQLTITARGQFGTNDATHNAGSANLVHQGEADGSCWGFPHHCSNSDAYLATSTKVFTFPDTRMDLSKVTYSGFRSVSRSSGQVKPAESMGSRATLTATIADSVDNDVYVPYPSKRTSNGTLFGKILARHPNIKGRKIERYSGFNPLEFDVDNFVSQEFIIDDVQLKKGLLTIKGVDPLQLAEETKSKAPITNNGTTASAITSGTGSFTYTNDVGFKYGQIGDSVFVDIESEIIECTVASEFGLTIVSRGVDGSEEKDHGINATVQECLVYDDVNVVEIIIDLLTRFTSINSRFFDDYAAVIAATSAITLTTKISKPEAVKKLVNELIVVGDLTMYFDENEKLIKIKQVAEQDIQPISINEGDHIEIDSASISLDAKSQYTRAGVNWAPYNATKAKETDDFSIKYLTVDLVAESDRNIGEVNEKDTFNCRWLTNQAGDTAKGTAIAQRAIDRTKLTPKIANVTLDAENVGDTQGGKLELGTIISLATSESQNTDGTTKSELYQIIKIQQRKDSMKHDVTARLFQDPIQGINIDFTISENKTDYDLSTEFAPVAGNYTVLIDLGVTIGATSTSSPAFTTGAQAAGVTFDFIVRGSVLGAGGNGGAGGVLVSPADDYYEQVGEVGFVGGDAFHATVDCTINTGSGEIWAGGGGAAGGTSYTFGDGTFVERKAGNGGSGGQGFIGGQGGTKGNANGYDFGAVNGSSGSVSAAGSVGSISGGSFGEKGDDQPQDDIIVNGELQVVSGRQGGDTGFAIVSNGNNVIITAGDNNLNIKGRRS